MNTTLLEQVKQEYRNAKRSSLFPPALENITEAAQRGESSAQLLYDHPRLTIDHISHLQRDLLSGGFCVQVEENVIHKLVKCPVRFRLTISGWA